MITIHIKDAGYISQKTYDDVISGLNLHDLTCTCGECGSLIHHGSYERKIKVPDGEFWLRVNRVKCTVCGHTHALLFSSMIPYAQILLKDQLAAIRCAEDRSGYEQILRENRTLDENLIRAVIRRYRKEWRQNILAHGISINSLEVIIKNCFSVFRKQFMQIRKTPNTLFLFPT